MSRARLALAALLVVFALVSACGADKSTAGSKPATNESVATDSPASSALPTAGPSDDGTVIPTPPAAATPPLTVAAEFAAAWVRADLDSGRWWQRIATLCEPNFAETLKTVDPADVPATKVVGRPVVARQAALDIPGLYKVPTDGGTLLITVAAVGDKWLVTDNDFDRATR